MGLTLLSLPVSRAEQLEDVFKQMAEQGVETVIVGAGHATGPQRQRIAELDRKSVV